jgi:hypothetical protein
MVALAVSLLLLPVGLAPATTVLSGTQQEMEVTLIASPQPYVIRGDYYVPAGKRLVIEAGTSFLAEKDATISVSGTLAINGAKGKPVTFRGKASGSSYWKGIRLQEPQDASIDFAAIEGAATAIYVYGCKPKIMNCTITRNKIGVKVRDNRGKACLIENCIITANDEDGILAALSEVQVKSCNIVGNKGLGVHGEFYGAAEITCSLISENRKGGIGCYGYESRTEAHDSCFEKNKGYDVLNTTSTEWDFSRNWWGDSATKLLISKGDTANLPNIHDGHDEEGKGKVRLHGFLREMPKDCGAFAGDQDNAEATGAQQTATGKGTPITFTRDCYAIAKSEDYYPFHVALANGDTAEVQQYVDAGRVFLIKSGMKGLAGGARGSAYWVRILDGPNNGKEGWVYGKNVKAE